MYEFLSIQATEADGVTEPVDLASVKAWANVDHTDDDVKLTGMITGARLDIEQLTGRKLVPYMVSVTVRTTGPDRFQLPYGSPASVTVLDDLTDEEVDADNYKLVAGSLRFYTSGTYRLSYDIGGSNAGLKELVKMLVTYRYNNPGDGEAKLSEDIIQRANQYRLEWL